MAVKSGAPLLEKSGFDPLDDLNSLFAAALWDFKVNTAASAYSQVSKASKARPYKSKRDSIAQQFAEWEKGCVSAIREWWPKYVDLAMAHPAQASSEPAQWAEAAVWAVLKGQCDVAEPSLPTPHLSSSVRWWLAVASDNNFEVNQGKKTWNAPVWLARTTKDSDKLLRDCSRALALRVFCAIEDAKKNTP